MLCPMWWGSHRKGLRSDVMWRRGDMQRVESVHAQSDCACKDSMGPFFAI